MHVFKSSKAFVLYKYQIILSEINLRLRCILILMQDFITSLIKMRFVNIQFDVIFAISFGGLPITVTLELSQ